jgi:hypothetical protein
MLSHQGFYKFKDIGSWITARSFDVPKLQSSQITRSPQPSQFSHYGLIH